MTGQGELAVSCARPGLDAATGSSRLEKSSARPGSALRDLMTPLDQLLVSGGDVRLSLQADGCNDYGCPPLPSPSLTSFSSSTATPISTRAYDRVVCARDQLLQESIISGLDDSCDARLDAMRDELKQHLDLSGTGVEVIFSASGTDTQLHALWLTQLVLGRPLTVIVAAADQTGSGSVHTARGLHFSDVTASGVKVRKGTPIAGLAESVTSIALPSFDVSGRPIPSAELDAVLFDAVNNAVARGHSVLLQTMDASKLGRRIPSHHCMALIANRWPEKVQIVVDACQMRLGRRRLRSYLERGFMVQVTGSKFFTGPAFSGALLVPARLSAAINRTHSIAPGLLDYAARNDWPRRWDLLRKQFPPRANFGQWLRWEAALEEIGTYFLIPEDLRRSAIAQLGRGIAGLIDASPSLRPISVETEQADGAPVDDDLEQQTIFSFAIERDGRRLSLDACKDIYRQLKATNCLVGQPVGWTGLDRPSLAVLRICVSARHVIESWSPEPSQAEQNVSRELERAARVVATIESLLAG